MAEDMKSQIQKHRKELKTIEYNRRKENKVKRKAEDLELAKREERVKEQEEHCRQVREELQKEMQGTNCPRKKALIKASLSQKNDSQSEPAPVTNQLIFTL